VKKATSILLKVCGMREEVNILQVAAIKPDYMGFIFYEKSPRYVGSDYKMPDLALPVKKVGVFVNASTDTMLKARDRYGLDYLQLHGHESPEQVRELVKGGAGIVKVFSVDDAFDFETTRPFAEHSDFYLFDTKGKYYGGNATRFDWRVLEKYNQEVPFLLSGGLSGENVFEVRQLGGMNLHALDINSGVEVGPAFKDINKVQAVKNELSKINNEITAL
jgi:phosphoribosylanthranilate isomerase